MTQHTIAAQIALSAMTPAQRVTVSHRDELPLAQRRASAQHAPHEDPAASTCDHREWPWLRRVCADDLGDDLSGARR